MRPLLALSGLTHSAVSSWRVSWAGSPSLAVVLAVTGGTSVLCHLILQQASLASFMAAGLSCGLGLRALTMPFHHLLPVKAGHKDRPYPGGSGVERLPS